MGITIVHDLPLWESAFSRQEMEKAKNTANYFLFCVDKTWCNILKDYGIKNVYFLPHYFPAELCYSVEDLPKMYRLSFVGNFLKPHFNSSLMLKTVVDFHLSQKKEDFHYDFISNVNKQIQRLYSKSKWDVLTDLHESFGFNYENFRYFVLSNLVERYKLALWGWPWCIPEEFKKHPNVQYNGPAHWLQLPIIFGLTEINLNIHRIVYDSGTQERTFLFAFCKAFFLTDHKEIFRDFLPHVYRDITFSNLKQLFAKIEYFSQYEKERKDIVNYIYETALSKHTIKDRAKEILQVVQLKYREHESTKHSRGTSERP